VKFSFRLTDEEILNRIKKGDEKVIEHLYKKYYKMMVNHILKNNGSEDEAKDIYQESLIVFWQKVSSGNLKLTSKISTYIYSICQNLWRKELDRKSKMLNSEERDIALEENYENYEKIKIIRECLNELGETCKKILTLYYFEELSMNDIAEQMGLANADTAKTRKYKCKQELDKLIKRKYSTKDFLD
jgi:RNA polymerase sigma factor (sigma-70 family)